MKQKNMPNYQNWMPKGMILGFAAAACVFALISGLTYGLMSAGGAKTAIVLIADLGILLCGAITVWCLTLYKAFDYNGKRNLSGQIINGVSDYIKLPEGGTCLDVGCGSGALTIACARKNPKASVTGIDRWGKEYASFSKPLCEQNAEAEGVNNVEFRKGDANKLEFADESFDAVTSNYVYHNIPSQNRQELIKETLRCLKKGGTFAIHDLFSASRYGDMQKLMQELKNSGYETVELKDTTDGTFMSRKEATLLGLTGSAVLYGKK